MRMHAALISFLGLGMLGCVQTACAQQARWFVDCKQAAKHSTKLSDFLEDPYRSILSGPCFLLNADELLYVDNNTETNFTGLYYVRLGDSNVEPVRLTTGLTKVGSEFVAINRKRYAWITSSWLNHGMYSHATYLLRLAPRSSEGVFNLTKLLANEGCFEPKVTPRAFNCEGPENSLEIADGRETSVQISWDNSTLYYKKPRLKTSNGLVNGLEFDLILEGKKRPLHSLIYKLEPRESDFVLPHLEVASRKVTHEIVGAKSSYRKKVHDLNPPEPKR
jgi:hypothetical protein